MKTKTTERNSRLIGMIAKYKGILRITDEHIADLLNIAPSTYSMNYKRTPVKLPIEKLMELKDAFHITQEEMMEVLR